MLTLPSSKKTQACDMVFGVLKSVEEGGRRRKGGREEVF